MKTRWFLLTLCALSALVDADRRTLHVGALFELSNHWYEKYIIFFVTILEHVFQEVDNRTDILADYSLKLITKDTQGKTGLAARRMIELMNEGPPIVAVIGPSLSSEMTMVGQIGPFCDVLQLSYIATTSSTVDRKLFPTLFRVNQILDDLNPLRIKMMQYFNWNRVATIFVQDDTSTSQMTLFHDLLKQHNMTLVTSAVVSDYSDVKLLISRMLHYEVRVIMGSFDWKVAPRIFCEAYRQGLYGRDYVWILSGPILYTNWIGKLVDRESMDCSFEEFLTATDGHFTLNYEKLDSQNPLTVADKTLDEITTILKSKLAQTQYTLSENYGWLYDTGWALAVGLNNSLSFLGPSGLDNYTNNPYYLDAIMKGMHQVSFSGISGPISFDKTGGRVGVTYIEQNFNDTKIPVAVYDHLADNLTWFVAVKSLWTDGKIPHDRFLYHRVKMAPDLLSLVLVMMGNTVCCVVALAFLGFNTFYRKNSNIKLSSPKINNVIIAGSILMYICVFITAADYGHLLPVTCDKRICMVRVWIMCLGFTTLFGALFSKTWRVHRLFRDYKLKKTVIKDYHLFGVIMFLLLVDCAILFPWSFIHSLQKESVAMKRKDHYDHNRFISEEYTFCHHVYENYWYVTVYVYKGLLLVFGTFLAWETRHVTVPALNDSKFIGFCIYNVVIVCIFGVPLTHALPTEQTTLNFVLPSALIMFCTTMCLCILFIPKIKIRNQVNDRFLNPALNTGTTKSSGNCSTLMSPRMSDRMSIIEVSGTSDERISTTKLDSQSNDDLKKEVDTLKMKIAAETIALARLKRDILQVTGNVHFYKVGSDYVVFKTQPNFRWSDAQDLRDNVSDQRKNHKEIQ